MWGKPIGDGVRFWSYRATDCQSFAVTERGVLAGVKGSCEALGAPLLFSELPRTVADEAAGRGATLGLAGKPVDFWGGTIGYLRRPAPHFLSDLVSSTFYYLLRTRPEALVLASILGRRCWGYASRHFLKSINRQSDDGVQVSKHARQAIPQFISLSDHHPTDTNRHR